MDYRKTNAPSNTVTRDMMKLKMIFLRSWRNLLPIMIIWKKFLKTESRLRFHVTMKNSQNRL